MDEWVHAQLAAGLPGLRGSAISGTLAMKQELINELLAQWLAAKAQSAGTSSRAPDLSQLLPFLKQAAVRAEAGAVLVDFQISI
jgi:hypothetical protein